MKPGMSNLNPYAASYIPLSKREADKTKATRVTVDASQGGNQTVWYGPPHTAEASTQKSHLDHCLHGSSSRVASELSGKQAMDEKFDLDLEYLQMLYPGLSFESLAGIYIANKGDLDATLDMVDQLEYDTLESSQDLPNSLDIGDVPESTSAGESSSVKAKHVVDEGSTSSVSSKPESVNT